MKYLVRPMRAEDIPQATEIDREAFATQWPPPYFRGELHNRLAHYMVAAEATNPTSAQPEGSSPKGGWQRLVSRLRFSSTKEMAPTSQEVAKTGQYLIGYAAFWMMVDEAHLTSIAVREVEQKKGFGELLLISVVNLAIQLDAEVITLEVRASNLPAQALYRKYGFKEVGVRRGYYSDDREDALIMTTDKLTSAGYQQLFQSLKQSYRQKWGEERHFLA
jgi:ribosomal-protein-alanine N-acetyltransferase